MVERLAGLLKVAVPISRPEVPICISAERRSCWWRHREGFTEFMESREIRSPTPTRRSHGPIPHWNHFEFFPYLKIHVTRLLIHHLGIWGSFVAPCVRSSHQSSITEYTRTTEAHPICSATIAYLLWMTCGTSWRVQGCGITDMRNQRVEAKMPCKQSNSTAVAARLSCSVASGPCVRACTYTQVEIGLYCTTYTMYSFLDDLLFHITRWNLTSTDCPFPSFCLFCFFLKAVLYCIPLRMIYSNDL